MRQYPREKALATIKTIIPVTLCTNKEAMAIIKEIAETTIKAIGR